MKILTKISLKDILGIFIFILLIIPAFIKKHFGNKRIWLICEHLTARDNGYFFFKYMIENHPEVNCYYAMDLKHCDYEKVKKIGNVIKWGSIKHYYYYMCSQWNMSSHKNGSPNHILFTFLRLHFNLYNNFVFLQHGVLYQNHEMFHKKNSKFKYFICGAKPEYDFLLEKYGYTSKELVYTGLARFDNLHNTECDKKVILYMPTYRRYLVKKDLLESSNYYKRILSFINSDELNDLLKKNDKYLYFCPHNGFKDSVDLFKSKNDRVKIIDISKQDVQELLIKGSLLITDFSSLHTDFAYMKKPIIYYQYDKEEFDKKHVGKYAYDTYFNFKKDGFGPVVEIEEELIEKIRIYCKSDFQVDNKYLTNSNIFFKLSDTNNCKRIYECLMEANHGKK